MIALVALFLAPAFRLPFVGLRSAATLFVTSAYVLLYLGGKAKRSGPPTA